MKTIIFVRTLFFGGDTGVETYCKHLIAKFESDKTERFKYYVLDINHNKLTEFSTIKKKNITYINVPMPLFEAYKLQGENDSMIFGATLARLLGDMPIPSDDIIVHINWVNHGMVVAGIKKVFNCKVILTRHCIPWKSMVHSNYRAFYQLTNNQIPEIFEGESKFERDNYEFVDHFIAVTKCSKVDLSRNYGIKNSKINVVYNGVQHHSHSVVGNKNILRDKYNISKEEKVLIYAGRGEKNIGLKWVIEAFNSVVIKYKLPCRLILAGNINLSDFNVLDLRAISRIACVGFVKYSDLTELYQLSDLGLVPSLYEQCSYTAIEMMQNELLVLCSRIDGLAEMVSNEETGLTFDIIFKEESIESCVESIIDRILYAFNEQNKEHILRIKTNALLQCAAKFNLDNSMGEVFDIYDAC